VVVVGLEVREAVRAVVGTVCFLQTLYKHFGGGGGFGCGWSGNSDKRRGMLGNHVGGDDITDVGVLGSEDSSAEFVEVIE
jgi:hypothetical protein